MKTKGKTEPCPVCDHPFKSQSTHNWILEIPEATPLANEFIRTRWGGGKNKAGLSRRQLKEKWSWLLVEAGAQHVPAQKKRRIVIVKRSCRGLEPDYSNLWLPIDKLIIDNLVSMGILIDDSRKYVNWWPVAVKAPNRKTVIDIREQV